MQKKVLFIGISTVIAVSIIIGLLVIQSRSRTGSDLYAFIPADAVMVLKINEINLLDDLNDSNHVWSEIKASCNLKAFQEKISLIDSFVDTSAELQRMLSTNPIITAAFNLGSTNLSFLTLLDLPEESGSKDFIRIIEQNLSLSLEDRVIRNYEGSKIYHLELDSSFSTYFCIKGNVVIFSKSQILLEKAIRQSSHARALSDNKQFQKITSISGANKKANIFLNLEKMGNLSAPFINKEYLGRVKSYSSFAGWSELDFYLHHDLLLMSGFISMQDSVPSFISTFSKQDPVNSQMHKILPSFIKSYLSLSISDIESFSQAYLQYLNANGKISEWNKEVNKARTSTGIDMPKFFSSLVDKEICIAHSDPDYRNPQGNTYLIIKSKSQRQAAQQMRAFVETAAKKGHNSSGYPFQTESGDKITMYSMPDPFVFASMLGGVFKTIEAKQATVYKNFVVFGPSQKALSEFIYFNELQKTLEYDESYMKFKDNMSQESYLVYYSSFYSTGNFLKQFIDKDVLRQMRQPESSSHNIGLQISQVSDMPYLSAIMKSHGSNRGEPKTVWESRLDTCISFKPQFVINHNTQETEILLQDQKESLYLLNKAGKILWKQPIGDEINSEVYQIDYYKNGKLQFLFSTKNHIHLIDRNGNYVERYPIALRSPASAGMALFDYENNKNYRIFIPCENHQVYAYAKDGSLIAGWQFEQSDYPVEEPIKHFRIAGKDFIVFGDKANTYILDRRGKTRVEVQESIAKSNNEYYLHNTDDIADSYFVTTDIQGSVYQIYIDGRVQKKDFGNLSQSHFFDFKDLDADGQKDYIFLDEGQLFAYTQENQKILEYKAKAEIEQKPVYYHFSHNDRKLGLVSRQEEKIYLLNKNGKLYDGFPLEGNTQFSIGYLDKRSNRFNLIVGGRNNFLYNYTVE